MPNFLEMLRARKTFENRPLGMPDIDSGSVNDMFSSVIPHVNAMKQEDERRKREMMEFQASLARRNQPQPGIQSRIPPKQVVFGGVHPPTALQRQFREDDVTATANKNALARQGALQTGALNNALITGKQNDEADMARAVAEINGRADVAKSNRLSVERAADDARTDKAKTDEIARTQKGPLVNVMNPKTGQMESRQYDPVTRKYAGITLDDDQAGTGYKQGTIPKATVNAGQDPAKLAALRKTTQGALNELDELLDPKSDTLRSHAADATGASGMLGQFSEFTHTSALTPETTRGRAGIKALRGKLVLNLIGEMKAQSKTGATGFGAMNKAELAILEDSASKLNPNLSDEAFAAELRKIRKQLQLIMQDAGGDAPNGGGPSGESSDAEKRADELGRKNGWW